MDSAINKGASLNGADLVKAEYHDIAVTFTEDAWFNATAVADKHGKRVADWLGNSETQNYISALAEILNVPKEALLKTRRGRYGGSWMHPRLGVPFARWLDVKFGVWCDDQIYKILTSKHPHYDWKKLRHEATASYKVMGQIDAQIIAVLKEDHPQSVRHVFYRMTDPRLSEPVEKSDKGYRHVQDRCVKLRRAGRVPVFSWKG